MKMGEVLMHFIRPPSISTKTPCCYDGLPSSSGEKLYYRNNNRGELFGDRVADDAAILLLVAREHDDLAVPDADLNMNS